MPHTHSRIALPSVTEEKEKNYIIYKCFHENIVVQKAGFAKSWVELVEDNLVDDSCLYVAYDLTYCRDPQARMGSKARQPRKKNVFLTWCPHNANNWERRLVGECLGGGPE